MKILIATDSYKGSLTSLEAAEIMKTGVLRVFPEAEVVIAPVADGGEGTMDAFVTGAGARPCAVRVCGPTGKPVDAAYAIAPDGTAIIEMAAAAGLGLAAEGERDPLSATTYGVGELIRAALDGGCKRVLIGLGGSATNDGGAGMAAALGARFLSAGGAELPPGGGALVDLAGIDLSGMDGRLANVEVAGLSDVRSPLLGPDGASMLFGPQKGADAAMVTRLEAALTRLADVTARHTGRELRDEPGAGAAGGLGFGLMAFCGARCRSGVDAVLDAVLPDSLFDGCDLVITGEGRMDRQSAFGKAPVGVARRAKGRGVPVLAIVGGIGDGAEAVYEHGIDALMCAVNAPMSTAEAIAACRPLLLSAAERAMRMARLGMGRAPALK